MRLDGAAVVMAVVVSVILVVAIVVVAAAVVKIVVEVVEALGVGAVVDESSKMKSPDPSS